VNRKFPHVNVVILGAGFAGVYAYLRVLKEYKNDKRVRITLINNKDEFVFIPLIHEVATGLLSPAGVTQPIRTLPTASNVRFLEADIETLDLDRKEVKVTYPNYSKDHKKDASELERETILYDFLVLALGSETNYYDVPGARENTLPIKNLDDTKKIKNHLIERFEEAEMLTSENEIRRALRFIIVGGGPTGVEMAGEIADLVVSELALAFPRVSGMASIVIIQGAPRLVPQMDQWFSRKVEKILYKKTRTRILLNARVTKVEPGKVFVGNESIITDTIIWTAGVKAKYLDIASVHPVEFEKKTGRIKVTSFLELPYYNGVFVIGDQAWVHEKDGQAYPMRAQFAVREGIVAAENIVRSLQGLSLKEFHFQDLGFILSIGKGGALAKIMGVRFSGPIAWLIYRAAYLTKVVGVRAKMNTLLDWTLNLFAPRDISKF